MLTTAKRVARQRGNPDQLIENRVAIAGQNSQLSIYDTYAPAARVALSSNHLLYCGMIHGRKIMHGATPTPREFCPNESFVIAAGQPVYIDFPDARPDCPTTCMTVEIDHRHLRRVCDRLEHDTPGAGHAPQAPAAPQALHVSHGGRVQALLDRLMRLYCDDHRDRDVLIDLALDELLIRMLRTKSRALLLESARSDEPPRHGLAAALWHLRQHISLPIDSQALARCACLSKAQLYRQFKRELGCTPGQFQQALRIEQARERLARRNESITHICFDLGYASASHFCRCFRQATGQTPSAFRSQHAGAPSPPERP